MACGMARGRGADRGEKFVELRRFLNAILSRNVLRTSFRRKARYAKGKASGNVPKSSGMTRSNVGRN